MAASISMRFPPHALARRNRTKNPYGPYPNPNSNFGPHPMATRRRNRRRRHHIHPPPPRDDFSLSSLDSPIQAPTEVQLSESNTATRRNHGIESENDGSSGEEEAFDGYLGFLRHTERCSALVHVVDGSSQQTEYEFDAVRLQLELFSPELAEKPYLVAYNKVDLPEVSERWISFKEKLQAHGIEPFCTSAVKREGTHEVICVLPTSLYKKETKIRRKKMHRF